MTAKPKRDERGQFMPKWAAELRELVDQHHDNIRDLFIRVGPLPGKIDELSSRLGTSTPLIIWNIVVLIAIAYLGIAHFAPGSVP